MFIIDYNYNVHHPICPILELTEIFLGRKVATLRDISNQIDSYCEDYGTTSNPLINQVRQYFQTQMSLRGGISGEYQILNETHLSDLVELFKPELQRWDLKVTPPIELNLLPILVNAILPTCDRLQVFKNMELDLEDIHFMEVKNSFSNVWRIPPTSRNEVRANAKMVERMTPYFLRKYAPDQVEQCEKIVTAYLTKYHEDPFQMTASLILLAKNNLFQGENVGIINSMANNKKVVKDGGCNLSTIAKSLVTLSRCSILSDELEA